MKPITVIASVIIALGVYLEYNEDKGLTFASFDAGSALMGAGIGMFIGHMMKG